MKKDRTAEIKKLWESSPKFAIEAGLSGDYEFVVGKALECMEWVADFQLKYKDEFRPFEGLSAIIDDSPKTYKDLSKTYFKGHKNDNK